MNDLFLRACAGQATERVPVWFMRQAGRSLPEYRALRAGHSILDMCRDPALVAEVTLQPVHRLGVDAAILFSDIVVPLLGMGVELDIVPGRGPVVDHPLRTDDDIARLRPLDPHADTGFVLAGIKLLREELAVPLIGFAGAPFTLASYLIEGGPSRDHARTKAMMHGAPQTWDRLMDVLADSVLAYMRAQVAAGAQAVQLFDSWVGHVEPGDYRARVMPWVARIIEGLADLGAPRILFGVGTGELLADMASTGPDVLGIDWRVPLDEGRRRAGGRPVQGNLDPSLLLAPWPVVERKATKILERGGGRGHVFNLGHGVLPDTDPDVLARLVDHVHGWEPL